MNFVPDSTKKEFEEKNRWKKLREEVEYKIIIGNLFDIFDVCAIEARVPAIINKLFH